MSTVIDTRERILSAAGNLIATRSYADVGVAEICRAAEVKKGSFYHFFPSKRELTLAVLDNTFVSFKTQLLNEAFSQMHQPMQRLNLLVQMLYEYQAGIAMETGFVPGCPFGNMAAEQATQDEDLRHKVQELMDRLSDQIQETLQQAVEQQLIEVIDTKATADAMLAYAEGVLLLAKTRNDAEVIMHLLPAMTAIRIN